jgi:hypothetical protein
MKAAYATVLQVQDGVCYGAFLSAGKRVQHESGIEELAWRLGLRRCPDGMLISYDRDPLRAFVFGVAEIDHELHAVFELASPWADNARGKLATRSPAAVRGVRRGIETLNELLTPQDDAPAKEAATRGFWDSDRFAITTCGTTRVTYLETLYLAALAGDLAPTYFDPGWTPQLDFVPDRRGLSEIGPGLGLFAAGLAPPDVRARIIEHQTQHGFEGRQFRLK